MERRIKQYIQAHHLLTHNDKVLVALSGGADSVALLHILLALRYRCEAVHCNFHLRGEESDRDEQFVVKLCAEWGVTLHIKHFNTTEYAAEQGISIEMAARELRYAWFEQICQERACTAIAVAHHQNDQAETVLLNLLRGSGLRGLEGMHTKNGNIIRPLLATSRQAIEDYLSLHHITYVIDSTNTDTQFKRNAIRAQMHAYTAAEVEHIAETATRMHGYETIVNAYIEQIKPTLLQPTHDGWQIHIATLLATPAPEIVLYELLRSFGFSQVNQIYKALHNESGKQFFHEKWRAVVDRDYLYISRAYQSEDITPVPNIIIRKQNPQKQFFDTNEWRALFDSRIAQKKLTIRHWQEGDWFMPLGLRGKKKLSDFFTDMKLSLPEKERVWLLCADEDIAWVIGYRIDERYKVKKDSQEVTEITIQ